MDFLVDFANFQIVIDIAMYALPVAVVFFILINVINTRRVKRLNLAGRSVDKMKREYVKNIGKVLEWDKAMTIGVRDLFTWEGIQTGEESMEGFIDLLANNGLEIELVPEVEGCTDSIEKTDLDCAKFRKIMNRMLVRTHGESYKNESI